MKKIYPSSSGFAWGDAIITEYDSGCPRMNLLTANGYRKDIPSSSQDMGREWEDLVFKRLTEEQPWAFHRELPFKKQINQECVVSGRLDYLLYDEERGTEILECKATAAKDAKYKILRDGEFKLNWLSQVACYMNSLGHSIAKILVLVKNGGERTFVVEAKKKGGLYVDGEGSGFNLHDQARHTQIISECLTEGIVWERPITFRGDPCKWCSKQLLCMKWDMGEIGNVEEYIRQGTQVS
jgi:hypothetical protein